MLKKYKIKNQSDFDEIKDSVIMTGEEVANIEFSFNKQSLNLFFLVIILAIAVLLGRNLYLSIIKNTYYKNIAEGNRTRVIPVKASRGKIKDRFGEVLAYNVPSLDLIFLAKDIKTEEQKERTCNTLNKIFPEKKKEIREIIELNIKKSDNIVILEHITQKEALLVMENKNQLVGIGVQKTAIRNYIDSLIFSHILGYEGKIQKKELEENPDYLLTDSIGKQGLEKQYEKYLKGVDGVVNVEVDSLGRAIRVIGVKDSVAGSELLLNIDAGLQKKIFDSLTSTLGKNELKAGAAVVINPKNGEILALVSIPSFDNNLFAEGISISGYQAISENPLRPMFNRATSGEYPPGSTVKPFLATMALKEGVITEHTQIESKGGINIGGWRFGDWKAHGFTDVRQAIAVSSDVFFYSIGGGYGNIRGIGIDKIKECYEMFGLGRKTGIDLPVEKNGFIPDKQWKLENIGEKWYKGNTYHAAIGQGYVTATPLQLAVATAAIANGGTIYQPKILSRIKRNNGEIINNKPTIVAKIPVSDSILRVAQEGMRMTVTDGTAKTLNNLSVEVAGKTGTAQYGGNKKTFGWFISYAPFDNPEIAIVILVEGQEDNSYNAVPITKEIYKYYFENSNR